MGEVTKLQHQNIRLYVVNVFRSVFTEKVYMVPLICLVLSVFRSVLCQFSECELQWFDPGFSLTGGIGCVICCVQRGSASNPSCTATHNLLWACGSQRCPGVRHSSCCVFLGAKDARDCVGEWVTSWVGHFRDQHFVPCTVGWAWMSWVAGLSREQGFAQFQGPAGVPDSNWLLLLSSLGSFLVKMWEDELWKSLCVGS